MVVVVLTAPASRQGDAGPAQGEIEPRSSRDPAEIEPRFSRDSAEIQPRSSRDLRPSRSSATSSATTTRRRCCRPPRSGTSPRISPYLPVSPHISRPRCWCLHHVCVCVCVCVCCVCVCVCVSHGPGRGGGAGGAEQRSLLAPSPRSRRRLTASRPPSEVLAKAKSKVEAALALPTLAEEASRKEVEERRCACSSLSLPSAWLLSGEPQGGGGATARALDRCQRRQARQAGRKADPAARRP